MAMSSLSAQLASLNAAGSGSSNKNAGFSQTASKRLEDAVGRGLLHSAKHGLSVSKRTSSQTPTLLYADGRAASDVPLTTLRENATASLRHLLQLHHNSFLEECMGNQALFGPQSLTYERNMATDATNHRMDKVINQLLSVLCTTLAQDSPKGNIVASVSSNSSSSSFVSSLHVLEYLVRRHDIHIRDATAERLVWMGLPHHDNPQILGRILQLVDITKLPPSLLFLRPFAVSSGSTVPRTTIAKRVALQDDSYLWTQFCQLAKDTAHTHSLEEESENARRGISRVVSFSAAVLVEALDLSQKRNANIPESTLCCLLPHVLEAAKSSDTICGDYKYGWAHILACTLAERTHLSEQATSVLSTTLISSIPWDNSHPPVDVETLANTILAAFAILMQGTTDDEVGTISSNDVNPSKLVAAAQSFKNKEASSVGLAYLPVGAYRALIRQDENSLLAASLGHLHTARSIDMTPLVASLLSTALFHLLEPILTNKLSNKKRAKQETNALRLILHLAHEPSLKGLWRNKLSISGGVTAAVAARVVMAFATGEKETTHLVPMCKSILEALRFVDSAGCDAGVAYAVTTCLEPTKKKKKKLSLTEIVLAKRKQLLNQLLHDINNGAPKSIEDEIDDLEENKGNMDVDPSNDVNMAHLMPPRVALEHPEASVRLNAIYSLIKQDKNEDIIGNDGESLVQALLRRLATDENIGVACAAGAALEMLMNNNPNTFNSMSNKRMAMTTDTTLQAFYKWSLVGGIHNETASKKKVKLSGKTTSQAEDDSITKQHASALCSSLAVAGHLARGILGVTSFEDTDIELSPRVAKNVYLIVEAIASHLSTHVEGVTVLHNQKLQATVTGSAASAICRVLSHYGDLKPEKAEALFINSKMCDLLIHRVCDGSRALNSIADALTSTQNLVHQRFVWMIIHSITKVIEQSKDSKATETLISNALLAVMYVTRSYQKAATTSTLFEKEACHLLKCVSVVAEQLDGRNKSSVIIDLASVHSPIAFQSISIPSITALCKQMCVSPIVAVMECASRSSVDDETIIRLLLVAREHVSSSSMSVGDIPSLVPALALLGHSERRVREGVLDFLAGVSTSVTDNSFNGQEKKTMECVAELCSFASGKNTSRTSMRSNLIMDGAASLSLLLSRAIQNSSKPDILRKCLLSSCVSATKSDDKSENEDWLVFANTSGNCRSAAILLAAFEASGESAFPLEQRWSQTGKHILNAFMKATSKNSSEKSLSLSAQAQCLLDSVVSMLKGIVLSGESDVVITLGPSNNNRRSRSYSVGTSDGISCLNPYPKDMVKAILDCVSLQYTDESDQPENIATSVHETVIRLVLTRQSWLQYVFPSLDTKNRRTLSSLLVTLRAEANVEAAGIALSGLPLDVSDFLFLLEKNELRKKDRTTYLVSLTIIADAIRARASIIWNDKNGLELISSIFKEIGFVSKTTASNQIEEQSNGLEFTRSCLMQTILALYKVMNTKEEPRSRRTLSDVSSHNLTDKNTINSSEHAALVVSLLGGQDSSKVKSLESSKGKTIAYSLLKELCGLFPTQVVPSLIPAILQVVTPMKENDSRNEELIFRRSTEMLSAVVPTYCTYARLAGLSFFDLLSPFLEKCENLRSRKTKVKYYKALLRALHVQTEKVSDDSQASSLASLVACIVTTDARTACLSPSNASSPVDEDDIELFESDDFLLTIFNESPVSDVVRASLKLFSYLDAFVSNTSPSKSEQSIDVSSEGTNFMTVQINDIERLAQFGLLSSKTGSLSSPPTNASPRAQMQIRMWSITKLLKVIGLTLSSSSVKNFVRTSDGDDARVCLRLWQEFLSLQSKTMEARSIVASSSEKAKKKANIQLSLDTGFWEATCNSVSDCLETVQRVLPSPLFLASVTSVLRDADSNSGIQKKALRLFTGRVCDIEPDSPEAGLFLEMVPDLVHFTGVSNNAQSDEDGIVFRQHISMQQAGLIALEQLARSLCLKADLVRRKEMASTFIPSLRMVTDLIGKIATRLSKDVDDSAGSQLISSSALCASTLIKILGARSLPLLPKLISPMMSCLTSVNVAISSSSLNNDEQSELSDAWKLLQLSILQTLMSMTQTIPQFLSPYLKDILSLSALPSPSLRSDIGDEASTVFTMTVELERALATKMPPRQLIPACCKAIVQIQHTNENECQALLSILKSSVESAPRSDLSPVVDKTLNALTTVYSLNEGKEFISNDLMESANAVLIAMVMKLSEAQLRHLYARLREWRGDLDVSTTEGKASACRRYAFWSLSAALSRALRSIFLPCLSSVISDTTDELEFAVSKLCTTGTKKLLGGKKKRKLSDEGEEETIDTYLLGPLKPLLMCLESALKADAHEGGAWVRADESRRYNVLLSPLGKLLHCRIPSTATLTYESLVENGSTTSDLDLRNGSVSGCLTALASAAGNEQLWKPLNHAILQACGNEDDRSEVKKAGVSCLLSVLKTLGEEYMVLLPECLPVLSELLEDEDEEIAAIAKDCIALGEELLGESLEDSLR